MKKAMAQVAASGDPDSPDTQFRKCYLQLAEAAATKEIDQVKLWGAKALSIACAPGWEAVKTDLRILKANAYTDVENYQQAQFHYYAGCKEEAAAKHVQAWQHALEATEYFYAMED